MKNKGLHYLLATKDEKNNVYLFKGFDKPIQLAGKIDEDRSFIPQKIINKKFFNENEDIVCGRVLFDIPYDYQFIHFNEVAMTIPPIINMFGEIQNTEDIVYECNSYYCDRGCNNEKGRKCRKTLENIQRYFVIVISKNESSILWGDQTKMINCSNDLCKNKVEVNINFKYEYCCSDVKSGVECEYECLGFHTNPVFCGNCGKG